MSNDNQKPFGEKAIFKRPNIVATVFQCVSDRAKKEALNVDFARNPNNYPDLVNKSTIQLSIDELPLLVALFMGLVQLC